MSEFPAPCFHGRIEAGRLKLDDREKFAQLVQRLDGQQISISIKKFRRSRSSNANRYYWGVCIPMLQEFCGYDDPEELHAGLKAKFLQRHEDSLVPTIASTANLDTSQFHEYVEKVRRLAAELGCVIPDPGDY